MKEGEAGERSRRSGSQAVHRALSILEHFDSGNRELSANQLAERMKLPPATVHRLINALMEYGLIRQDRHSKKYTIGPAVLRLALLVQADEPTLQEAERLAQRVQRRYGESVSLQLASRTNRVCIKEFESDHIVKAVSGVGRTYPLSSGAAGKALIAFFPHLLSERKGGGGTSGELLETELAEVRRNGFAVSFGETLPGARAVAAPLTPEFSSLQLCINVTGPSDRLPVERLEQIGRGLVEMIGEQFGTFDKADTI